MDKVTWESTGEWARNEKNTIYKWGGGFASTVRKQTAPPLNSFYSNETEVGGNAIPVRGHKRRCLALEYAWGKAFEIDEALTPISVLDIAFRNGYKTPALPHHDRFVVELTDVPVSGHLAPIWVDIVLNYQPGADTNEKDYLLVFPEAKLLLGVDYFFTDMFPEENSFLNTKNEDIVVIPNGNKEAFFQQVNLCELITQSGRSVFVAQGMSPTKLKRIMRKSAVVITTPSVTALEAISLGAVVLYAKTSMDQTGEFKKNQIAQPYSLKLLLSLLNNKAALNDIGEQVGGIVKNNIDTVVETIYKEWKEWSKQ